MKRKVLWLLFVLAILGLASVALWWFIRLKPPPKFAPIEGEEGAGPASLRLPLPDQPLWRGQRLTGDYYGLQSTQFIKAYWQTRRLGEPEPLKGEIYSVGPFMLAAQPLLDEYDYSSAFEEMVIMERIVRTLRDAKILSAANPVVLVFPHNRSDPSTWESNDREPWIGIPVPQGTEVPPSLRLVPFQGGEVLLGEPVERVHGMSIDWAALVKKASELGKQPDFPIIYRYSGWQSQEGRIMVQPMLLLKAADR